MRTTMPARGEVWLADLDPVRSISTARLLELWGAVAPTTLAAVEGHLARLLGIQDCATGSVLSPGVCGIRGVFWCDAAISRSQNATRQDDEKARPFPINRGCLASTTETTRQAISSQRPASRAVAGRPASVRRASRS